MVIKKLLQYGFLAALVLGTVFVWHRVPLPCGHPIDYSLGTFDPRFGLGEADFLKEAASAERLWEGVAGKELFRYVPGAAFKVNLIFDQRQEQTFEAQKLEDSLRTTEHTNATLDQKQKRTLALYDQAGKDYERLLVSFKKRLRAYNVEVEKWNKRGGAPPAEYQNLQEVSQALEKDQQELETKRQEVNRLATQVNAFSKEKVAAIDAYNGQVQEYADRYGDSQEFDQGEYIGKEIDIYQYDDLPHLEAVLAHEFGHALGLAHGTDPRSIMYHLMKDQKLDPPTLTEEDKTMLSVQCSQTVWDIILLRISILRQRFTL